MKIVTETAGTSLVFKNLVEIELFVGKIQEYYQNLRHSETMSAPFLYTIAHETTPEEDIKKHQDAINPN